ncbi:MAG TPA: hypothetical protein VGK09_05870 [Rhodocyclaceae bacterium]
MSVPMPIRWPALLALFSLLGLTACGATDGAAYKIDGRSDMAISVIREQNWMWSNWEVSIVVARQPDCMRRHHVKPVSKDVLFKVELYRSLEGGYILRQGKRWYVTETAQCQLQKFDTPPAEPGDLVGTFIDKDGELQFKPAEPTDTPIPPQASR